MARMRRLSDTPSDVPEILALRALKLGDLLVAVPAIHALKRERPDHDLVLAIPGWLEPIAELTGADVLHPTPGLDHPLAEPARAGRFDTVVNLHGNGPESRGVLDLLDAPHRIGHRASGWDGPEWEDGVLERHRWARLVDSFGIPADRDDIAIDRPAVRNVAPGAVVVHVGAFYGSRHWPEERFARVAQGFAADGHRVVFTGSAAERPRAVEVARLAGLPDESVLAGTIDLAEMALVVAEAALVVSVDTGAAHLASAYGTPSVVLFGPAPVEEWGPPEHGPHIVLTDASLRVGDTFGTEPDPALLAVQPADVLSAGREVVRGVEPGATALSPGPIGQATGPAERTDE